MRDLLVSAYPWIKALHVFSVILWMSAQLTLPVLLTAHRRQPTGSAHALLLTDLERQLIRRVLNPAILAAFLFGGLMIYALVATSGSLPHWLGVKLTLVVILSAVHGFLVREGKRVAAGQGRWTDAAWRRVQWSDLLLLAGVVVLVITKPVY